jgi:dolichyl-diphosphooligosaccharide--protein glycosyltransferase
VNGLSFNTINKPFVAIWLLACAVLAVVLRSLPYRGFLDAGGNYLFYGPDSYEHLRRITLGMGSFPAVPVFDSYTGYPQGTGQIWAPLFDYALSALALLFGGSASTAHTIGFWLSPALSVLAVLMVYLAAARLAGRTVGAVAALLISVLPGNILYSLVSELDHHVLEPILCLVIIYLLPSATRQTKARIPPWIATALCLVLILLFWRGSVIFWGIAMLSLTAQIVLDGLHRRDTLTLTRYSVQSALLAAALIAASIVSGVFAAPQNISFGVISWFHVLLLSGFAVFTGLLHGFIAYPAMRKKILAAALVLPLFLFVPPVAEFIREFFIGLSVITGSDPWLDSISELRPMLFPQGQFNIWHSVETLSGFYWLIPLSWLFVLREWRQDNWQGFNYCVLLTASIVLFALPIFRERYVHLAAIGTAFSGGLLFVWLKQRLGKYNPKLAFGVTALALLLLTAPVLGFLQHLPRMALPPQERYDLPDALAWLRTATPLASHYADPVETPEYGVIANWGLGAYIPSLAQRPSVATNYGWETYGLFASAEFLSTSEPQIALDLAQENRVDYILLQNDLNTVALLYDIAAYRRSRDKQPPAPEFNLLLSMQHRLYIHNGSAFRDTASGSIIPSLGHYRLVFQSRNGITFPGIGFIGHYKIFATVPGATIQGTAPPGTMVSVRIALSDPLGREILFQDRLAASTDGGFSIRVPYAADSPSGIYRPLSAYQISYADKSLTVPVTEQQIQSGAIIRLP